MRPYNRPLAATCLIEEAGYLKRRVDSYIRPSCPEHHREGEFTSTLEPEVLAWVLVTIKIYVRDRYSTHGGFVVRLCPGLSRASWNVSVPLYFRLKFKT